MKLLSRPSVGLQDDGFTLFVSGNYKKAQNGSHRAFRGSAFSGSCRPTKYHGYLRSVSMVMDLTTEEDCLVCGAYEALAAKRPLIVSRTVALSSILEMQRC